jgi:hypothetical protein
MRQKLRQPPQEPITQEPRDCVALADGRDAEVSAREVIPGEAGPAGAGFTAESSAVSF